MRDLILIAAAACVGYCLRELLSPGPVLVDPHPDTHEYVVVDGWMYECERPRWTVTMTSN